MLVAAKDAFEPYLAPVVVDASRAEPAAMTPVGGTPGTLENNAGIPQLYHFPIAFVDYSVNAVLNSHGFAAKPDHFGIESHASISAASVKCFANFIKISDSDELANL